MKKSAIILSLLLVAINFTGCKSEKKKTEKKEVKEVAKMYSLFKATNNIQWTAYKTTEKKPVKGTFKTVNITKNGVGNSVKEAVNNAEFSIPVASIFSNNAARDSKLIKLFFGVMNQTELLSGTLKLTDDTTGTATITMNGVTENLPFTYTINDKEFQLDATLDLKKWKAENAVASLNKACFELHKGADGVSKTWDDVTLHITSTFQ